MANLQVKDGAGSTKYAKATGAGTDVDPAVVHHNIDVIAAGDNNIGNVDLASSIPAGTNNIGDVDVLTVPAPLSTTGGGTEATALRVTLANDSTGLVSIDDNGGSITVDGTVTANLAAGTNNIGDVDVLTVPAPLSTTGGGTEATALRVTLANDSTGVLSVDDNGSSLTVDDGAGSLTVDNAGTFAVQATLAAETTKVIGTVNISASQSVGLSAGNNNVGDVDVASIAAGDNNIGNIDVVTMPTGSSSAAVQGTVAHDGVAANNPILNGGYAVSSEPAAVANADVARLITDLVGKLITLPYANPENFVSGATAAITDTTRTSLIAAQASGVRTYLTQIIVTNSHASVGTFVLIEDGTTTVYVGYAAPAGGGFSVTLPVPLRGTAATAWNVSCVTTGANVRVSASGYKGV